MKRFVFRLASVLRVREFELDRTRMRLAQLERERTRRAAVLEKTAHCLEKGRQLLQAETEAGADGERLALRAGGVTVGRMSLEQAHKALLDLEPPLTIAREQVREARTRVRSLERLRERQAEAHRLKSSSIEQAELEELALARIARTPRQPGRANQESLS